MPPPPLPPYALNPDSSWEPANWACHGNDTRVHVECSRPRESQSVIPGIRLILTHGWTCLQVLPVPETSGIPVETVHSVFKVPCPIPPFYPCATVALSFAKATLISRPLYRYNFSHSYASAVQCTPPLPPPWASPAASD